MSEELAEIQTLDAENRRLREDDDMLRRVTTFRRGTRPPQPPIMGFIDTMRAEGEALESTCRVLRERAARSPRELTAAGTEQGPFRPGPCLRPTSWIRCGDIAWITKVDADGVMVRRLTADG